jgi:hypothetical protein
MPVAKALSLIKQARIAPSLPVRNVSMDLRR